MTDRDDRRDRISAATDANEPPGSVIEPDLAKVGQGRGGAGRIAQLIAPYRRPEMAAMILLGFGSGLPLYLVYQKTSFWMREEGVDLTVIGFFFWVGMFYTFKFVWAPIVDKLEVPFLHKRVGHRRSWMMAAIAGTMLGLCIIAASDPSEGILTIVLGAMILAFFGSTLDVSIDAWRIESAPSDRQANMAAAYSLGYRGALIFSNLGFVIAGWASWNLSFLTMALAMGTTAALILLIKEPTDRRAMTDTHDLPFFAGPWNAIAVATALFVLARVFRWFPFDWLPIDAASLIAILVLALGPLVLRGTRSSLALRAAIAGAGSLFVYAREGSFLLGLAPTEDGPPWFRLAVIAVSLTAVGLYGWLVLRAILGNRDHTSLTAEGPRGKVYTLFGTPFLQVWDRYGKVVVLIIGFVMVYRLSDFTMGVMAIPLYADLGYDKVLVGGLQGGPGVVSTIVGLFVGGAVANWIGVRPSLVIGGGLTFLTNGFYAFFAGTATGEDPTFLATAICADNVAGGFVTTVFIAYLSSLVDPRYAATQYALFSSLYALVNKFVAGFSGAMADALGYVWFFLITASYAIPATFLIFVLMAVHRDPQRSQEAEPDAVPAPAN